MTVKELKEVLQDLPEDKDVYISRMEKLQSNKNEIDYHTRIFKAVEVSVKIDDVVELNFTETESL